MTQAHQIVFGPFCLDPATNRLWRGEHPVELQPRPLAVLHYLAQRPGQVVAKEELLKQVWAGTYVTKTVLKVCVRAIRQALGEEVTAPRYLETVGRDGYRFIAAVSRAGLSVLSPESGPIPTPQPSAPIVVGRDAELSQLRGLLERVSRGRRQVVFVTGGAGVGKTTVVDLFLERVRAAGEVWVGRGQCLEQYGEGEAYLPVLEALGQLCRGPGGKQVLSVLHRYAPTWVAQMPSLMAEAELETLQRKAAGVTQERMLREMAEALEALTAERGLVLVLEDLHVSDRSTAELIAYLAQRRERARLMVIGTYRPTGVVLKEHPLKGVKQELSAKGQCTELQMELLSQEEVGEYVAKRLAVATVPAELTQLVYERTDGNALFMVNVLEYCLQQGLVAEKAGQWELQVDAEATGVPESVQQMIEKQVEGLTEDEQHLLEMASVVGEEFTAAAVAAALQSEVDVVEKACEELVHKSHFLQEEGVEEWPDGTVSGRYAFRHVLYQNVLYGRMAAARRVRWHRLVAERQEQAYGARAREIAAELAMHFERGRDYHRAVQYLQLAGENAVRRSAYQEAISYLTKGLRLLAVLPDTPECAQRELSLQLTLGLPLAATKGYAAPEIEQTYARARALCRLMSETCCSPERPLLFPALVGLWAFYLVRGKLQTALELATQGLRLAEQAQNPSFLLEAHLGLGLISCFSGELSIARAHLEQGITLARTLDRTDRFPTFFQDSEVGCLTYVASVLWHLGYPDQARVRMGEAVALARQLAHPFSEAYALNHGAGLQMLCRDLSTFRKWIAEALTLARAQGFPHWVGLGTAINGWALIEQGQTEGGISQVRQGLAVYQAIGTELSKSFFLLLLAKAYLRAGQTDEGLTLLTEAHEFIETTGERLYEAELYRLKGELTLQKEARGRRLETRSSSPQAASLKPQVSRVVAQEAEGYFLRAIEVARRQQAKSLELRAAVSLARLWQQQGKKEEAYFLLVEIYGWFTEGFDTKDLQEAKGLLEALA